MKKIIYFVATLLLMNFTSCNDILDQDPNNSLSGGTMWTTESQVDGAMNGLYSSLQKPIQGENLVGQGVNIGYYGFEALGMSGQASYAIHNLFTSGVNPSNKRFSFTWKWCYDGVNRSNDVIANIGKVQMAETKRTRLIAEAKFFRAFFYTRLNELFGNSEVGVPLYLEPITKDQATKTQSTEAEVWAQIIADLTDAINEANLPNNLANSKSGRITKGAAYALRGRAYLISKEYAKAVSDFEEVGKCGYALYPDYQKLFTVAQENCEEMILSSQNLSDVDYGSKIQKFAAPFQAGAKDNRSCWTDLQITPAVVDLYEVIVDANTVKPFKWGDFIAEWDNLSTVERKVFFVRDSLYKNKPIYKTVTAVITTEVNKIPTSARGLYKPEGNEARLLTAYTNRDPRLSYNVITPYSTFVGVNSTSTEAATYQFKWPVASKAYADEAKADNNLRPGEGILPALAANAQSKMMYMFRKFIGTGLEYDRREDAPIDEPIIRYADVLLMSAEASVELGNLSDAMTKVKQVRDRVGIPTMSANFSDQTTARNYVRDERRREFVGEGVNFFDEMRWRTIKETKYAQQFPQLIWGSTAGVTIYQWPGDHFYTWPVPKTEIELNSNLKKTPGWTY